MPEQFKLIEEKFSEVDQEWQWTYKVQFSFAFKKKTINYITITDHIWQKKERKWMTKKHILNILTAELNGWARLKVKQRVNNRDIYVREWVPYLDKDYLLVFWFKDNTDNHLWWVRNCYPIS